MQSNDKSLQEVWEWKEKIFQEIKDLSSQEYIEKITREVEKIYSDFGIELSSLSLEESK